MDTPLRKLRLRRGYTQTDVAACAQIDQGHYSRIERAEEGASAATAARLVQFFGRPLTELQVLYPERYTDDGVKA